MNISAQRTLPPADSYIKFGKIHMAVECLFPKQGEFSLLNPSKLIFLADILDGTTRRAFTKQLRLFAKRCRPNQEVRLEVIKESDLPDSAIVCSLNEQKTEVRIRMPERLKNKSVWGALMPYETTQTVLH